MSITTLDLGKPATPFWQRPAFWDRTEQALIVLLWVWLVQRVVHSGNPFAPLLLLSESAVLFFVLIRKPTEAISVRPGDWMLAITATAAPLLMLPSDNLFPAIAPLAVSLWLVGNVLQVCAKLALFRSFGVAPANRGVKISGPYKLMRHPMYAGYLLVHIGYMLLMTSWVNALIYAIGWWAQIKRLLAEERLLSEDVAYQEFKKTTKWRLIPGVF